MLSWPDERVQDGDITNRWQHRGSNLCLDLHGDPLRAGVVILSDGNHHMALNDVVRVYAGLNPGDAPPFYATFPPAVIAMIVRDGQVRLGNLVLSLRPDVLLGPPQFLQGLGDIAFTGVSKPFVQGRGCSLLVAEGNPKRIRGVEDLDREDVRLFLSNPETEKVSYNGYAAALRRAAAHAGVDTGFLDPANGRLMYGECIHHREAPEAVASGRVDVAVVYHHLALRYCRVFPQLFEQQPLETGGGASTSESAPERNTVFALLSGDARPSGEGFYAFLDTARVREIYDHHGLDRIE
ncbi:MAG: substrate-binding domain-containing protein [Gammaproteobacteria bacterium]|nr:substrate-binding domain-containing protein [Gammaproteobacteria bacterium]